MGWTTEKICYQDHEDPTIKTILDKIKNRLNSLNEAGAASVKVIACDRSIGKPVGVIIYNQNLNLDNMNPTQLTLNWSKQEFKKNDISEVLNDLSSFIETLSDLQVFYSKITLSTFDDGPYTCALFYRT